MPPWQFVVFCVVVTVIAFGPLIWANWPLIQFLWRHRRGGGVINCANCRNPTTEKFGSYFICPNCRQGIDWRVALAEMTQSDLASCLRHARVDDPEGCPICGMSECDCEQW